MHGAEIEILIRLLSRLPGMGPRSARRAVLHLLRHRDSLMSPLSQALDVAARALKTCPHCGNYDTVSPCSICADPLRDRSILCVVEGVGDIWAIERSRSFRGLYHVLGGVLSALDGIAPEDLSVAPLVARAAENDVREVILALDATVDGQTTSHYLAGRLKDCKVVVSRLAHGVPVGGDLDFLDDGTLMAALRARSALPGA